jgi:hypothetical protein
MVDFVGGHHHHRTASDTASGSSSSGKPGLYSQLHQLIFLSSLFRIAFVSKLIYKAENEGQAKVEQ